MNTLAAMAPLPRSRQTHHDQLPRMLAVAAATVPEQIGRVARCRRPIAGCAGRAVAGLLHLPGVKAARRAPGDGAVALISVCCSVVILMPSFAATGRGWAHPTSTCRRPAPGRRARWLKLQGDRCVGYRRAASNGAD